MDWFVLIKSTLIAWLPSMQWLKQWFPLTALVVGVVSYVFYRIVWVPFFKQTGLSLIRWSTLWQGAVVVGWYYMVVQAILLFPPLLLLTAPVVAFFVVLFLLPFVPGLIRKLSVSFNRETGDVKPGFFMYPEQGRIIIIERGKNFFKAIMAHADHMFRGEKRNALTPNQPEYHDIVPTRELDDPVVYQDTHPIPPPIKNTEEVLARPLWLVRAPLSVPWWVWKRHVFELTGAVFSGVKGYQQPRIYPITKIVKTKQQGGKHLFDVVASFSDHLRASVFEIIILVGDANTRDQSAVFVAVSLFLYTINPFRAAYRTEWKWPERIDSLATGVIGNFCRFRPMDEVLAAKDEKGAGALAEYLRTELTAPFEAIGIGFQEVVPVNVLDISPTTEELKRQLEALSAARIQKLADMELAIGRTAYAERMAKLAQDNPEALAFAEIDSRVSMSANMAANPNAVVILSPGGAPPVDPIAAATLRGVNNLGTQQKGKN